MFPRQILAPVRFLIRFLILFQVLLVVPLVGSGFLFAFAQAQEPKQPERQPIAAQADPNAASSHLRPFRVSIVGEQGPTEEPMEPVAFEVLDHAGGLLDKPIYSGTTDERGTSEILLPEQAIGTDAKGQPEVLLRIAEPGMQQRYARWNAGPNETSPPTLTVQLIRGATAVGRLLDSQGNPARARLYVEASAPLHGLRRVRNAPQAEDNIPGWFSIHFTKEQRVDIVAEAEGQGTAALLGVELTLDSPPSNLSLRLGGPGVIRGVVQSAQGAPQMGLVVMLERRVEVGLDSTQALTWAGTNWHPDSPGLLHAVAQTDRQGRFEVLGLAAGSYDLSVLRRDSNLAKREVLTPEPWVANGTTHRLEYFEPNIVLQLMDASGRPYRGPIAGVSPSQEVHGREAATWPKDPKVLVAPSLEGIDGPWAWPEQTRGKDLGEGCLVFPATEGQSYWVGILGGRFAPTFRAVQVPAGGLPSPVDFRASTQRVVPCGTLKVQLELPKGHGRDDGRDCCLWLETIDQGLVLVDWGQHALQAEPVLLPVGSYRVVAEGNRSPGQAWDATPRVLGRAQAIVQIEAGQAREIRLPLDYGSHLALLLRGELDASDLLAMQADEPHEEDTFEGETSSMTGASIRACQGVCKVALFRKQQLPETAAWMCPEVGAPILAWPLDQVQTSELLPSGPYEVRVTLPGGRIFKKPVTLNPGETSSLEIHW
ncbi:MAG: hypothetical protein H6830_06820 [Planctomycetes bacterium]|nr:hypothetical protein [Planctomycetota bacterium]MCB9911171.1 hypothetical protein [Planctomycetota bacterium]MCB9911513.1 hypothetical protein [Planctomycetota bacterium]